MKNRLLFVLSLAAASLLLGACQQINDFSQTDVSQFLDLPFYGALQVTVAAIRIPVIVAGLLSLLVGWKLGRFGLAISGFTIAGLMLYTFLADSGWVMDENIRLGLSIVGAILFGAMAYFLYNLMALIMGGAIGSTLMNGAWFQIADSVPPQVLVFVTTFVSALIMFIVFRLFLVAFSAIIGAAILMLAIPYDALWAIPVAAFGIIFQISFALWLKDDIFKNLRGDFTAALGQAFGEILGPVGTLRDYQKSNQEKASAEPKAAKAKPAAQKPSYEATQPKPATPLPSYYQSTQNPYAPPAKPAVSPQSYKPVQASYPASQAAVPSQASPYINAPTHVNLSRTEIAPTQANFVFHPEQYQIMLSTGQTFPLAGAQITVGRSPDNTIVLNDLQVSAYHLMLSIQEEGVVAWDNNSTNGTYLNGVMLQGSVRLTTTDVLQVGSTSLRLVRIAH